MENPKAQHPRQQYEQSVAAIRAGFDAGIRSPSSGATAIRARAAAVDALVTSLWASLLPAEPGLASGISVLAVGGYGRGELFPSSDVDLMFLLDGRVPERQVKESIRRLNQMLWDAGLRVSPMTRTLAECGRFDPENVEFTLALLDARALAGDPDLSARLLTTVIPRLLARDAARIAARLLDVTRTRHARYGDTLFHLEPNVKDCPGGLRDAHVYAWLTRLHPTPDPPPPPGFLEARDFLLLVRAFLHFRHGRDDNTLDWQAQDAAAAAHAGQAAVNRPVSEAVDAAYWMRLYFRHARSSVRAKGGADVGGGAAWGNRPWPLRRA